MLMMMVMMMVMMLMMMVMLMLMMMLMMMVMMLMMMMVMMMLMMMVMMLMMMTVKTTRSLLILTNSHISNNHSFRDKTYNQTHKCVCVCAFNLLRPFKHIVYLTIVQIAIILYVPLCGVCKFLTWVTKANIFICLSKVSQYKGYALVFINILTF